MSARRNVWAVLVVLLLLLAAVLPVAAQDEEPLTEEEQANLALVEQFFAIYNDYDMDAMGELLTDDVVWTWSDPSLSEPMSAKAKRAHSSCMQGQIQRHVCASCGRSRRRRHGPHHRTLGQ